MAIVASCHAWVEIAIANGAQWLSKVPDPCIELDWGGTIELLLRFLIAIL
jgi:hypothetical protein